MQLGAREKKESHKIEKEIQNTKQINGQRTMLTPTIMQVSPVSMNATIAVVVTGSDACLYASLGRPPTRAEHQAVACMPARGGGGEARGGGGEARGGGGEARGGEPQSQRLDLNINSLAHHPFTFATTAVGASPLSTTTTVATVAASPASLPPGAGADFPHPSGSIASAATLNVRRTRARNYHARTTTPHTTTPHSTTPHSTTPHSTTPHATTPHTTTPRHTPALRMFTRKCGARACVG